jgi:hypothetical protein
VFDGILKQRLEQKLWQQHSGGLRCDIPFEAERASVPHFEDFGVTPKPVDVDF